MRSGPTVHSFEGPIDWNGTPSSVESRTGDLRKGRMCKKLSRSKPVRSNRQDSYGRRKKNRPAYGRRFYRFKYAQTLIPVNLILVSIFVVFCHKSAPWRAFLMIFGGHFPLGCPDLLKPSRASKSLTRPQIVGSKMFKSLKEVNDYFNLSVRSNFNTREFNTR